MKSCWPPPSSCASSQRPGPRLPPCACLRTERKCQPSTSCRLDAHTCTAGRGRISQAHSPPPVGAEDMAAGRARGVPGGGGSMTPLPMPPPDRSSTPVQSPKNTGGDRRRPNRASSWGWRGTERRTRVQIIITMRKILERPPYHSSGALPSCSLVAPQDTNEHQVFVSQDAYTHSHPLTQLMGRDPKKARRTHLAPRACVEAGGRVGAAEAGMECTWERR